MKKSGTKRTLLLSICSIVLCLAMLVGTTFAWFTSTASTEINEIVTGELTIDIQDENSQSVRGKTLNFIPKDGRTTILWEPNCTYVLPEIKLVNTGSLALKCKLTASAPTEDEGKLLDVIDFTYKIGDEEFKLDEDITLYPAGTEGKPSETGMITISAHMQETAGNEYQNRKLSGIKLVVTATQVPYEFDSIDDQYDVNAPYLVEAATADEFYKGLKETGYVELTSDVALSKLTRPSTPVVTIVASEENPATITNTAGYTIAFTPASEDDPYFAENEEFTLNLQNVTMVNGEKGKTGVVFGQYRNPVVDGKTLNINGGTFETHSGTNNGAIAVATVKNSSINISDATFIAYHSSSAQYAAYICMNTNSGMSPENVTVTFTNCTFKLDDGTVIDPVALQTENPGLFGNLFYGFGGTNTVIFN